MDKKLLENQTLKLIEQALPKDDHSIINLVRFARKNELFFPELYELWYISKVNQNVMLAKNFTFDGYHNDFGINPEKAGTIFADAFNSCIIEFRKIVTPFGITQYCKRVLDSGICFDQDFWKNNYLVQNIPPEKIDEIHVLKDLNSKNFAAWLDEQMPEKQNFKQRKI